MESGLIVTTIVTVFLAFAGYIVTYLINVATDRNRERLDRVNRQLRDLYGPLFALTQASKSTWEEFTKDFSSKYPTPVGGLFMKGEEPSQEKIKEWALWMTTVFAPLHQELFRLVTENSDLLIEEEMPQCLLELAAHVSSYRVVFAKWEEGDYSEYTALINSPTDLVAYTERSYQALKAEQLRLLGQKKQERK